SAAGCCADPAGSAVRAASSACSPSGAEWARSDSLSARASSSCSTQYVLSVKVEHPGNAQPCSIGINNTLTGPGRKGDATLGAMPGTCRAVSRIVSVVALVLVAAGCGGSMRPQQSVVRGIPPALVHDWGGRASAIAAAADAGDD